MRQEWSKYDHVLAHMTGSMCPSKSNNKSWRKETFLKPDQLHPSGNFQSGPIHLCSLIELILNDKIEIVFFPQVVISWRSLTEI